MKTTLSLASFFVLSISVLTSCSSSKETLAQRKMDVAESKEGSECFVQMNDGSIRNFKTLKLVTGMFTAPYLLGDGHEKIKPGSIKAYQNKDHYAISQAYIVAGRRSYVAVESLPGFAVRILKGDLNVYVKKYFNGAAAVDEYFMQNGEDGPIVALSPALFNELLRDNPGAGSLFENKKYFATLSKKIEKSKLDDEKQPLLTRNK